MIGSALPFADRGKDNFRALQYSVRVFACDYSKSFFVPSHDGTLLAIEATEVHSPQAYGSVRERKTGKLLER